MSGPFDRIWHLDDPQRFQAFRQVSEEMTLPPGVGLPGRIFESGLPGVDRGREG